jgi:Ser/Thr protein kinase RdoA (MazF antagonist)
VDAEELLAYARGAFGWGEDASAVPGARGALGQIWRVETGGRRLALKEIFGEPPSDALLARELDLARRARHAGVKLPASHPATDGRYLVAIPGGTWLRLFDWIDLRKLDPPEPDTPTKLGTLLAKLHRAAPPATTEADGEPQDPWYHRMPTAEELEPPPDAPWAARQHQRIATLPELTARVRPANAEELRICHRDLHPENVQADETGELVVIDWDNLGPAAPTQELAQVIYDWFGDPTPDLEPMRATVAAYEDAGGPGRITRLEDFTMHLACRLNFLKAQTRVVKDPDTEPRHRAYAEYEIDESLRCLPTPETLRQVLEAVR